VTVDGLYGQDSGTIPLGTTFSLPQVDTDRVPELRPVEDRLGALAGDPPGIPLRLGATTGRLSLEEHVLPLEVRYGLFDRVSIGASVPFIRRQVDTLLRYVPEGANVGTSPGATAPLAVVTFLTAATTALEQTRSAVDGFCAGSGESDPECAGGRALVDEGESFLGLLETSYEGDFFPLAATSLGVAVEDRWNTLATGFAGWDASAPGDIPLATSHITEELFRQSVVVPTWPGGGIPLTTALPFWDLGDIELIGAVRLLEMAKEPPNDTGLRADLVGVVRFATAAPDSLRALAPGSRARGVGGVEVRVETELRIPRFALLGAVEGGWHGEREIVLLAPDAARPFSPGSARARVLWSPGDDLRLTLLPRVRLGAVLSIGAGWNVLRQGADRFAPLDDSETAVPEPRGARTLHGLILELRYSTLGLPAAEAVRFPFAAFLRISGSVAGSGEWSPVERGVEGGVSVLLRR
jgi:hypothetical protein